MRDKQIHRINAQFVKRALQRLLTFGPVESRINQQAFLPFYNVGVQLPQRVMRQGYGLSVYIFRNFFQHKSVPSFRSPIWHILP